MEGTCKLIVTSISQGTTGWGTVGTGRFGGWGWASW